MPFLPPEALADEASIATAAARAVTLARAGEARAGLNLALQARRQAQGHDMTRGELEALNAVAMVHLIRGDAIAAVATAIDARDLARRTGDRTGLHRAIVSLQMSAVVLGASDDALAILQECTQHSLEAGDCALEIRSRVAVGIVLGDAERFDAADYEFRRALDLALLNPGAHSAARITANIANLHLKRARALFATGFEARALHECDSAGALARTACELATREGAVSVEIDALAIGGCAAELRGQRAQGRLLLQASIALGRATRCPAAIVWVLCELGRMAKLDSHLQEAHAAYLNAYEIACEVRPSRKIATACLGIAEVEALGGSVEAAREWRERAAEETAAFEIARLQTRRQIG
jgi:hypothetical protein